MSKLSILFGARCSVLALLCFALIVSQLSAQTDECGVPDMTYSEWQL